MPKDNTLFPTHGDNFVTVAVLPDDQAFTSLVSSLFSPPAPPDDLVLDVDDGTPYTYGDFKADYEVALAEFLRTHKIV